MVTKAFYRFRAVEKISFPYHCHLRSSWNLRSVFEAQNSPSSLPRIFVFKVSCVDPWHSHLMPRWSVWQRNSCYLIQTSNLLPAPAVVLIGGCSLINLHIKHPLVRELKDLKGHNCKSSVHWKFVSTTTSPNMAANDIQIRWSSPSTGKALSSLI